MKEEMDLPDEKATETMNTSPQLYFPQFDVSQQKYP